MTRDLFNKCFAALSHAWPSDRITGETQDIYFEMLHEIPDNVFQEGIRKVLASNQFFPSIHEIGVACCGEQKEEVVWKCDPWRTIQNYKETVPAKTWQQNLDSMLGREAIEDKRKSGQPTAIGTVLKDAIGH